MADTSIEWTQKTWNPTVGCTKISPGCKHCYAKTMHGRLTEMGQAKYAEPFETVKPYPDHLEQPLRWKKPSRIFVNSMSDLFHKDLPDKYIAAVFGVMAACPQHTFQVLTKRADRMREWFEKIGKHPLGPGPVMHSACAPLLSQQEPESYDHGKEPAVVLRNEEAMERLLEAEWPLPNVWLGVSAENQEHADERIPLLLQTPAAVRFVSYEPALGPVNFTRVQWPGKHKVDVLRGGAWDLEGWPGFTNHSDMETIDWVIVGGESGPGARPFHLEWASDTIEQCRRAGVACFTKQLGAKPVAHWSNGDPADLIILRSKKGGDMSEWPEDLRVRQLPFGK